MPPGESSKKSWDGRVPKDYVTVTEAARIIGRAQSVVRSYAIKLDLTKLAGRGQPSLIKISDLEGLKEMLNEVKPKVRGKDKSKPRPRHKLELGDPAPKWTEPILLAPSPEKEFEVAVRRVLHLMEKMGIDSLTMQDGKAEILRTVSVTKKEEIKG